MRLTREDLLKDIQSSKEFFDRSTRVLVEEDSKFSPKPEVMTAAQQVAHVAHTIDWFLDGAFRKEGFDLDFEKHGKVVNAITSLKKARAWLDRSFANLCEAIQSKSDAEWDAPLPEGMIMGGEPRRSILCAIVEHTAHHRGALTVYSRMLGKVPPMPYMEM